MRDMGNTACVFFQSLLLVFRALGSLSSSLSLPGCPTKKIVCDSNTCHNGGTCVNQWDAFSCECPLGFGGKSCAQGRSGSCHRLGPGCCQSSGITGRAWGRLWAGFCELGCGWKSMSGQSQEKLGRRQRAYSEAGAGHNAGRAWNR